MVRNVKNPLRHQHPRRKLLLNLSLKNYFIINLVHKIFRVENTKKYMVFIKTILWILLKNKDVNKSICAGYSACPDGSNLNFNLELETWYWNERVRGQSLQKLKLISKTVTSYIKILSFVLFKGACPFVASLFYFQSV